LREREGGGRERVRESVRERLPPCYNLIAAGRTATPVWGRRGEGERGRGREKESV